MIVVDRAVPEGAPHPLEHAGIGVKDHHPMIAVAVRDIHFVALRMHPGVGRPMQVLRVGVALALVAVPDLQDELAVLGEFEQLIVPPGWPRAGQLLPPIQTKPL
jgi:hypothetical protein